MHKAEVTLGDPIPEQFASGVADTQVSPIGGIGGTGGVTPTAHTAATLPHREAPPPARTPDELLPGAIFDARYRIVRPIGQGGMGTIYLAEHLQLGHPLAIKILAGQLALREDWVLRFYREARAASLVRHENIVSVLDIGRSPSGLLYFVMEYLDGHNLRWHLRNHGPFTVARARHIGLQICRALEATHARGIIHRDLKPDNTVLLSPQDPKAAPAGLLGDRRSDVVKLLDFGVAKVQGGLEQNISLAGAIFGTPAYMAPEQVGGEVVDPRADLYSLGCVLYEMLSGVVPFASGTVAGVLTKQLFDVPEPLRRRVPDRHVPPELDAAILRALSKDRGRRFPDARAMAEALAAVSVDDAQSAAPTIEIQSANRLEASLLACWLELERGDAVRALARIERVIESAGGIASPRLTPHADLLERFYSRLAGPLGRRVRAGRAPSDLDPRSAFILSRLDVPLTLDELCDVSAMPRFAALRLCIQLIRAGALEVS